MDADRRRLERMGDAASDPEALVREAVSYRRQGDLDRARSALDRAFALAPEHVQARALLLLVDVAQGRRTRGAFAEFRHHTKARGDALVPHLDPRTLGAIALSALDAAQGPVDAEAIEALVASGKPGVKALVEALARHDLAALPKSLRIAVGLRARQIKDARLAPEEVPAELRRRTLAGLESEAPDLVADWSLLAGALGMVEARRTLERGLLSEDVVVRNGAVWALELLASPESRPALESALARARGRGERRLIERALEALG